MDMAENNEMVDKRLEALYRCQALCTGLLRFTAVDEDNLSGIEDEILAYFRGVTRGLWEEFASRMFRNCLNGNYVVEYFIAKDGKSPKEEMGLLCERMGMADKIPPAAIAPLSAREMKSLVKLGLEVVMPSWIRYDLISRAAERKCVSCVYYSTA
jgi:hypothetical protein